MTFDDTYTDLEFTRRLKDANQDWMRQIPRPEPDLAVQGLTSSLASWLVALFSGRHDR